MGVEIVTVSERPDLAPLVASWVVEAFFTGPGGYTVEQMTAMILAPPVGPEENFVLLDDGKPVAAAALTHKDLDARPDLTPWLAGVWVDPAFRNRGHATTLVRQVENLARSAGVGTLWLYTSTAEELYARLGWERVGIEWDGHRDVVLMRQTLNAPQPAGG